MTASPALGRRSLLLGAALAPLAALTACSSAKDTSGGSTSSAAGSSAGATRTVTDAVGTKVKVPATPSKVVILHYAGVEAALDLGVVPIGMGAAGSAGVQPVDVVPAALWNKIKDVPVVVDGGEPDVEKVAGLEPDLILAHNAMEDDVLKQLREIAPVYVWTLRGKDRAAWDQRVKEIADALNRTEAYEKLAADWKSELAAVKDKHADVINGLVVGVLSSYSEGNMYLWGQENMAGTVLTPLGLTYSAAENKAVAASGEKEPEAEVSVEKIGQALGDVQLLLHDSDLKGKANAFLASVMASPLYKQLPAVTKGNVFPFFKTTIAGYTDARESLAMVDKALAAYKA